MQCWKIDNYAACFCCVWLCAMADSWIWLAIKSSWSPKFRTFLNSNLPASRAPYALHNMKMAETGKETGKKRKRNADDSSTPSKKVAIQATSPVKNIKVSVVPGTQEWAPLVGMLQAPQMPRIEICISQVIIFYLRHQELIKCSFHSRPCSIWHNCLPSIHQAPKECPHTTWRGWHHCHKWAARAVLRISVNRLPGTRGGSRERR